MSSWTEMNDQCDRESLGLRVLHRVLLVVFTVFFSGCKLHIIAPEHANITTSSGNYFCAAGDVCTIEIDDYFDELFLAEPEPGYYFHSWKNEQDHLCGNTLTECSVSLTAQTEHITIRESDSVGYLEPDIRPISAGWRPIEQGLNEVDDEGLKACLRSNIERAKVRYVEALQFVFCGPSQNNGYRINSLKGLDQFYNIQRLGFYDANLADMATMTGLVNLKYLLTQYTFLDDLSALAHFSTIEELKLYGGVGSLTGVQEMTSLKRLLVWYYSGSTTALAGTPNLEVAQFEYAQIIDLVDFAMLPKIKHLIFNSPNLEDISGLENMSRSLRSLSLNGSSGRSLSSDGSSRSFFEQGALTDLAPLAGLTWLKRLSILNSKVIDISPLERLTSLISLSLTNNKIGSVYPLAGLTSLKKLDLRDNNFGDISPLEYMEDLVDLNLGGNKIKLIRMGLRGMTRGSVSLVDNPLSCLDLQYYKLEKPSAVQVYSNVVCEG